MVISVSQGRAAKDYQALGSDIRLKVLRELLREDCSISDLSEAVGLRPVTLRYHLNILVGDGLVERSTRRREGEVGRPPIRYRLRREGIVQGFPPRQYGMLAEILLGIIQGELKPRDSERALEAAGREVGRRFIETVARDEGVSSWGPKEFVRFYLERALARMGLLNVVVKLTDDSVQYRALSCPFQELAVAHPDLICDHLDVGFHKGVAESLGSGVREERLACIGHGDPHCEYRLRWIGDKEGGA